MWHIKGIHKNAYKTLQKYFDQLIVDDVAMKTVLIFVQCEGYAFMIIQQINELFTCVINSICIFLHVCKNKEMRALRWTF